MCEQRAGGGLDTETTAERFLPQPCPLAPAFHPSCLSVWREEEGLSGGAHISVQKTEKHIPVLENSIQTETQEQRSLDTDTSEQVRS